MYAIEGQTWKDKRRSNMYQNNDLVYKSNIYYLIYIIYIRFVM